jgi:uncharacterized protein YaeQ
MRYPAPVLGLATRTRLDLALHRDGEGPVRVRLVLDKRAGESAGHVLLKLLGFALHHRPGLAVEASAGQKYKPDLLLADPDGTVRLWIDCGHVGPRKLAEVLHRNRRAEVVVLKATLREARLFAATAAKVLAPALARTSAAADRDGAGRLRLEAFRDGFLDDLAALVTDHGLLEVRITGGAATDRPPRPPESETTARASGEPPAPSRPVPASGPSPASPSGRSVRISAGARTAASPVLEVPLD